MNTFFYIYSYLQIIIYGTNIMLQGIADWGGGEGGEQAEGDLDTESTILQESHRVCELLCALSLTPVDLEKNRLDYHETRVCIFLFPVYCSSSLNNRLVWLASNEPSLNEVKTKCVCGFPLKLFKLLISLPDFCRQLNLDRYCTEIEWKPRIGEGR